MEINIKIKSMLSETNVYADSKKNILIINDKQIATDVGLFSDKVISIFKELKQVIMPYSTDISIYSIKILNGTHTYLLDGSALDENFYKLTDLITNTLKADYDFAPLTYKLNAKGGVK